MSCSEISADWAAQRIKGLNLYQAIISSLGFGRKSSDGGVIKTLIGSFRYPRLGPGQMWERTRDRVVEMGGSVLMGSQIVSLKQHQDTKQWVAIVRDTNGGEIKVTADHVVSTTAMAALVDLVGSEAGTSLENAASNLRYRDFVTVALIARGKERFDDNWIYIHDPNVKVGRIQNFKSWSPHMVPDPSTACYGLEYFCFEGDGLWTSSDADLVALAKAEMTKLGLIAADDVIDGAVIRQPKAYPVYDDFYRFNVDTIRDELEHRFTNLHMAGRNGMHKYNNQDHAMMTGLLTARNIIKGSEQFDVWGVNEDAEYHEGDAGKPDGLIEERLVPRRA
jgi:protoporphyrinogen oxidase